MVLAQSNPTKLRVGASGTLEGRACKVLGRVVLSTADGYRWQEYRVQFSDRTEATLVFESGDWKIFRLFEPASAPVLREAALLRVDDLVTIDGRSIVVTYVGKSRVVYIEGEAPEGMESGDRADYFNAEPAQGDMVVVSWTGSEMEFYKGYGVSGRAVAEAFGLPRPNFLVRAVDGFRHMPFSFGQVIGVGCVLAFVLLQIVTSIERDPVFDEAPARRAAPAAALRTYRRGQLEGHTYTVGGHVVVEVARPGARFDRHEYALTDEKGAKALLIQGPDGNATEWQLLFPVPVAPAFTPLVAARTPMGKIMTAEGKPGDAMPWLLRFGPIQGDAATWPAAQQYGFMVRIQNEFVHARWTENAIQVFTGRRIPARDIAAAFQTPELDAH